MRAEVPLEAGVPADGSEEQANALMLNTIDESTKIKCENPRNAMSVDVEDYFQVSAFDDVVSRGDWGNIECRIPRNIDKILQRFAEAGVKGTFFTLGWVAENHAAVIRAIAAEGHEIASHSFSHARVSGQSPTAFSEDVQRTKKVLEDVSGTEVVGYRAPSFSISKDSLWAHDVLQEAGYIYSSSIYPISHDHYGLPSAPRFPFRLKREGLLEIPMTAIKFAGRNWPGAGGGYFRLLPVMYSTWSIRRVNQSEGMPAVFYFHPWELDPDQPRLTGIPLKSRFRHYVNLEKFESRLTTLLQTFDWARMDRIYRAAF